MTAETDLPDSEPSPAPPDAGRAFGQVALLLPVLSLPMLWPVALWNLRRPVQGEEGRRWRRYLVALAIVDTLVAAALVPVARFWWQSPSQTSTVSGPVAIQRPQRVIGIRMDPVPRTDGVAVIEVLPGSPAARAGLRAGDVVVAVDGQPVRMSADVQRAIQGSEGAPGEVRVVRVLRDGRLIERKMRPVSRASIPARKQGVFEAAAEDACPASEILPTDPLAWGSLLVMVAVLFAIGAWRRLGPKVSFALFVGLPVLVLVGGSLCAYGVCYALGGRTLGGGALAMLAGEGLLLGGSLVFLRRLRRWGLLDGPGAVVEPRLSTARAVFLGGGYMVGGALRAGLIIAGIGALTMTMLQVGGDPLDLALHSYDLGPSALALLFLLAVVVGPAAEEVYFRGVMLPWLGSGLGPTGALWVSSILFGLLHLHYGIQTLLAVVYGFALGWARLRSGRLWAPFILHAAMNLLAGSVLLGR